MFVKQNYKIISVFKEMFHITNIDYRWTKNVIVLIYLLLLVLMLMLWLLDLKNTIYSENSTTSLLILKKISHDEFF